MLKSFGLSGIMLGLLIVALAAQAPQGAQGQPGAGQRGEGKRGGAPAGPPAPCGPASTLPADLAKTISIEEMADIVEYLATLKKK